MCRARLRTSVVREIGVGHAEPRQNARFELFHRLGLGIGLVIVAQQVQKSMHREMCKMIGE